jgi:hypothetical protein
LDLSNFKSSWLFPNACYSGTRFSVDSSMNRYDFLVQKNILHELSTCTYDRLNTNLIFEIGDVTPFWFRSESASNSPSWLNCLSLENHTQLSTVLSVPICHFVIVNEVAGNDTTVFVETNVSTSPHQSGTFLNAIVDSLPSL